MHLGSAIEYAVNGLQAGLLLFVISAGLTLSFGLMRVVNMAHGSFYMAGAFLGLTVAQRSGSFVLGMVVAAAGAAVLGLLVERTLFSRLYSRGPFAQMLVSLGLIFVLDELVKMVWGGDIRSLPRPAALAQSFEWGGASIERYRLFLIATAAVLSVALFAGLSRTPFGLAVRAAVDDRESAELIGLRVASLFSTVFMLGAVLAGVAGFVAIPLVGGKPVVAAHPVVDETLQPAGVGAIDPVGVIIGHRSPASLRQPRRDPRYDGGIDPNFEWLNRAHL